MRSTIVAVLSLLCVGTIGCSAEEPAADVTKDAGDQSACACDAGKGGESVWCADCTKGYVGGEAVTKCEGCFAAKTGGPECEACAAK